jgi:hypothetical protein
VAVVADLERRRGGVFPHLDAHVPRVGVSGDGPERLVGDSEHELLHVAWQLKLRVNADVDRDAGFRDRPRELDQSAPELAILEARG